MLFLLLFFVFAVDMPHSIQAMVTSEQAKTSGGAYIIRSFKIDQKDFILRSNPNNQNDALLWYPSGKVYVRSRQGITKYIGQGTIAREGDTASFYLPDNYKIKIKEDIRKENDPSVRSLLYKAILTDPLGEDVFFESVQTQILQDNQWVTP